MVAQQYAVIMAGGRGTRFWPLSRSHRPKQLLKIVSRKSLFQESVERILPLFRRERILVVTVAEHYRQLRKQRPLLPDKNFLIEPEGKNTAPCLGLAAVEVMRRDPNAIMAILPSDHWVTNPRSFLRALRTAGEWAGRSDDLVTIGIAPDYPETGYGYILKGKRLKGAAGGPAFRVAAFKEKPTRPRASQLIRKGALWNSGIFVWKASTFLRLLSRFAPPIAQAIRKIAQETRGKKPGFRRPGAAAVLRRAYRKMPNISIDHALLEKAAAEGRVLTLQADFGWSDLGSWAAVHRLLPKDRRGNGGLGSWLGYQSKDCLVHAPERLVVLLGMEKTFVVDTPDALLIGDLRRAQEVKDLVEELKRKGYGQYTLTGEGPR